VRDKVPRSYKENCQITLSMKTCYIHIKALSFLTLSLSFFLSFFEERNNKNGRKKEKERSLPIFPFFIPFFSFFLSFFLFIYLFIYFFFSHKKITKEENKKDKETGTTLKKEQAALEKTNMPTFLMLFNSITSVASFNDGKLYILVSMVTFLTWLLWLNFRSTYLVHCCSSKGLTAI
jgi:quinol-cytochrome oxidoreductase complex cytochrome b subunit